MKFRTELNIKQELPKITYKDNLLFLGSCFADNISQYFKQYRFNSVCNPFGTLYHPVAIANAIQIALKEDYKHKVIETNGLWTSYDVHSSLNRDTKKAFLENFKLKQAELNDQLTKTDFLFITLGTAHVYKHLQSETIVANCHKIPQKEFEKQLLSVDEIKTALEQTIQSLTSVNLSIKIVFTLSPVRYLRDGFEENQLSKSLLYLAIKNCVAKHDRLFYFPGYELVLDDLRDYRFYEKDLVHPNQMALDYVWEKLKETFFSTETLDILKRVEKINSRLDHRLFNPETATAKAFKNDTKKLIKTLTKDCPDIDFGF
jgi:hypothetical protein